MGERDKRADRLAIASESSPPPRLVAGSHRRWLGFRRAITDAGAPSVTDHGGQREVDPRYIAGTSGCERYGLTASRRQSEYTSIRAGRRRRRGGERRQVATAGGVASGRRDKLSAVGRAAARASASRLHEPKYPQGRRYGHPPGTDPAAGRPERPVRPFATIR